MAEELFYPERLGPDRAELARGLLKVGDARVRCNDHGWLNITHPELFSVANTCAGMRRQQETASAFARLYQHMALVVVKPGLSPRCILRRIADGTLGMGRHGLRLPWPTLGEFRHL
jgi:hypothetical protein